MKKTHSAAVFLVSTDEDHPQLICKTYEEALHYARNTAHVSTVDVWNTNDGTTYELVARYRS